MKTTCFQQTVNLWLTDISIKLLGSTILIRVKPINTRHVTVSCVFECKVFKTLGLENESKIGS